ncbi:Protein CBG27748 [Caenorhabditis briggsae]|uniref:Protein CBG27748 n=1 Tax=Caenorhabditis briggsae TaxID=6238 RepID=B6IJ46_CAEBR|nr:Protein CBG27748 [Caenorhabditis briggsae]CAS00026.1 Protein CBG27748 [Caenorhabditis briggsae]
MLAGDSFMNDSDSREARGEGTKEKFSTPDSEHHHREKLYTTEESDIDDHETEQAIEIFEEPSNFKTIKVQQLVYKIQEEEEKLNG